MKNKFNYKSIVTIIFDHIVLYIYKLITKKAKSVYLNPIDIISIGPILHGRYEQHLNDFLRRQSETGYSEFFIDIGANIGLTTIDIGDCFDEIVCFEPNPLCVNILRTNLALNLPNSKYTIHNFGLGSRDTTDTLVIPHRNMGGAFVNSALNSYSPEILNNKDSDTGSEINDFALKQEIEIKDATRELDACFSVFRKRHKKKGIIKVDVEGMEPIILKGIGATLPKDISVIICFENWDKNIDLEAIMDMFPNRVTASRVIHASTLRHHAWIMKIISVLAGGKYYTLEKIDSKSKPVGEIIIHISEVE